MNKTQIIEHFDRYANKRPDNFQRNYRYHKQIVDVCTPFLNPGARVLEIGCSTGDLLHAIQPDNGFGIDISPQAIHIAKQNYPQYTFHVADGETLLEDNLFDEPFDLIILSDLVAYLDDVQQLFQDLRSLMKPTSRLVVSLWNWLWQPALILGEKLQLKQPDIDVRENWFSPTTIQNLLTLEDYDVLETTPGLLLPLDVPLVSPIINSLAYSPLLGRFSILHSVVARPKAIPDIEHKSVTVVIPTRNEYGNIEALVERTPDMGTHTELLFIDGNSTDGTVEKIHEMIAARPDRDIKFMPQVAPQEDDNPPDLMLKLGKGDAVRKAFDAASGDILMILDSDVSVPPEELTKFYDALVSGKADFINGTRFHYPQEDEAMRPLNTLGNVGFSLLFSWLLGQRVTDTLCGTKVLYKKDYERIAQNRSYFGDFDPFGDFDLLFGAAWLKMRIVDLPVHYLARTYGDSKVRVGLHGPLLIRMSLIAFWHFKVRPLLPFGETTERPTTTDTEQPEKNRWTRLLMIIGILSVAVWLFNKSDDNDD